MNETFDQVQFTQILYEISMSVGNSVELRPMLKSSVSTILKKLNCVSGGVFQKTEEQQPGVYQLEAVYTIPRRPERNKTFQEAISCLPQAFNDDNYDDFLASLPLVEQGKDGNFYHIFELPNFGALLLIKNRESLNSNLIKSLKPLLSKLAAASLACMNEAKLRQNEERYRMFTEATFDGIIVHDGPVVKEINHALAETIQYTPEDLIGKSIFDFLDPSCHELAHDMALQLNNTPYELVAVRKDGVHIPVEVTDKEFTEGDTTYRVTAVRDLSHQKRLETELSSLVERRTRQVETSVQIAQTIAEATDLRNLYQRIVTEINEQLGYYHTQLLRYNSDLDAVELIAGYGEIGEKMLANKHQMPLGEGLIGIAAATGETVLRSSLTDDPDWSSNPLLPETKGELAVPIKLNEEILGVLDVQSDTLDALTSNDQLLLEGLCGQIAVAINTTRLTEERLKTEKALQQSQETLQHTLKRQQALHDVNLELASIQELDELCQQVIIKARESLGFDRIGLYLMDFESEELRGTYGVDTKGKVHAIKDDRFSFTEGEWVKNFVYNEDRLLVNEHTDLLDAQEVIGHGWHLVAAMWIRDIPIGAIFADNLISQQPFESYLPELISAYSRDVANLINRLRVEEALQQSQKALQETLTREKTLHDVNLELSSIQDIDELYQQIIIKAREDLGFDRIGLFLVDMDAEELSGTYGIDPKGNLISIKHDTFNFSSGDWIKNIVHSQERVFVREDQDLLEGQEVIGHGWHITSTMRIRDALIGVMFADNLVSQQPYQPHLPELISAYSTDVANLINRLRAEQGMRDREHTIQEFLEKQQELHEISIQLSRHNNLDELFQEAILLAQSKLGFGRIGLYLYDANKDIVHGTYGIGTDGKLRKEYHLEHNLKNEAWMQRFLYERERLSVSEDVPLYEDGGVIGHGWSVTAALWQAGKPIGLLFADNFLDQKPLETYQPELLTAFGATVGNQISRIEDDLQRREAEDAVVRQAVDLQIVADLSTQITTIQKPQELLEMIVQETQQQFNLYHCHIFLVDESGKNLRIQACGWQPEAEEYGTHGDSVIALDAKKSLVAQAARSKLPVFTNDTSNDPNWLPNEQLPDTRSELAVPMIVGDTVVGVLDVQATETDRFNSEDVQIQLTLASQIAVALENSRSIARSQEVIAEMDELTRRLTRESWEEYLTDLEEKDMGVVYQAGEFMPVDTEVSEADTQETAVTTNGHLSQSLMVHGEPIGQLTIFNDEDTAEMNSDAAIIMAAIAEQLSARVENIRLTEQTQQALAQTQVQAERLGLLNEVSAKMSNVETLDQVFDIIFARIPSLLKVDRVSLAMLQPDKKTIKIIGYEGSEMDIPEGTIIPLEDSPMDEAMQTGKIVVDHKTSLQMGIKSSMVAPIFSAGNPIGTLNIVSNKSNALTEQDESLLQQLATMLSSVIENKQLLAAAQARAERERQVRTITDKIRRGIDREAILNIAQEEIGKLIGAKQTKAQLGTKTQLLERIQKTLEQAQQES